MAVNSNHPPKSSPTPLCLERKLNLFDSAMIMMGIVIGSGIFLTTGIMATSIPSPGLILLAWLVGGLLTLAGALTYAELGAALPEAGGQYVYLREAFGPLVAFLFGWVLFLVYMTGGIAALALAFSEYLSYFFPFFSSENLVFSLKISESIHYGLSTGQLLGVILITFLTVVNIWGLILGKSLQNFLTVIKIVMIGGLIIFGLTLGQGEWFSLQLSPSGHTFWELLSGFGVALIAVTWAFDGWNNVNFVAGEIKNPGRNLPLALVLGTLSVTTLYLLVNLLYFYALPLEKVAGVVRIGEKATSALFGGPSGALISVLILISIFGALNGSVLAGGRVYYAMAKDGLFFSSAATINRRFRTPSFALAIQALWSCFLVIMGKFEQILTYAMFVAIIFWIAAAAAVFRLRKIRPDLKRPYKTWGYPVVPGLFIIASLGIILNTLIQKPTEAGAGLLVTLTGLPVYFYWKKRASSSPK